jgi:uncharacterized surface protein with fasciclin (FAS1) repeats
MLRRTTAVVGLVAASALAAGLLAAPASASNARATATIWDAVEGSSDFSTLQLAIEVSDAQNGSSYEATLDNPAINVTVFAPTNAAFDKVADELNFDSAVDLAVYLANAGLLDDVLAYHVVGADRPAASLVKRTDRSVATLLAGATITVTPNGTVRDAAPSTSDAAITATDIRVANGRVHVINNVLVPLAI